MTTLEEWIMAFICILFAASIIVFNWKIMSIENTQDMLLDDREKGLFPTFNAPPPPPIGKRKYVNFCLWSGVEFYIIKYVNKHSEAISTLHLQLKECQKEIIETGSTMLVFKDVKGCLHTIHAFCSHGQYGEPKYTVRKVKAKDK